MKNIPLCDFDRQVYRCVNTATGLVKCCALSAYVHLEKAWLLSNLDEEMSLFRVITAEEEMARAIFMALINLKYTNADKLKANSHVQKQGLYPFCTAIWQFLDPSRTSGNQVQLYIEELTKPFLRLRILIPGNMHITPDPPLYQIAKQDDRELYKFEKELKDYAKTKGADSINKHIKELAELRNTLLYAHDNQLPTFQGDIKAELIKRTKIVANLARLLCLIFPYKKKSPLVDQCLEIYLNEIAKDRQKKCDKTI